MTRFKIIMFATALSLPLTVFSQPQKPQLPPPPSKQTGPVLVQNMDKDGDKKVSRKEFLKASEERAEKQFNNLDLNKDGFISSEEETKARDQAFEIMRKQMEAARARSNQPK